MPTIKQFSRNFPTEVAIVTLDVDDNGVPVVVDGIFPVHNDFYYIEQGILFHRRDDGEPEVIEAAPA